MEIKGVKGVITPLRSLGVKANSFASEVGTHHDASAQCIHPQMYWPLSPFISLYLHLPPKTRTCPLCETLCTLR